MFSQSILADLVIPDIPARYNIAPTNSVACVRRSSDSGEPGFFWLHWGLLPGWAKEKKVGARMINARGETVAEKPAFRSAFRKRRCLVVADGFYEWLSTPDGKQPFYVTMRDDSPFLMAGLWEVNKQIQAEALESCTVITTNPNELMVDIHDRMPVILSMDQVELWLDPDFHEADPLLNLLKPFDARKMSVRPVSRNVNKVGYDHPDAIQPVDTQGRLF